MKQSPRAKRLAKHHKRNSTVSKLNLVSLMDIFTILVFFLIVNQSEVRVLQTGKDISLPISIAEKLPAENLVIMVLADKVLVQERSVWQANNNSSITDHVAGGNSTSDNSIIAAISQELNYQANKRPELTVLEQEKGRAVTIIGDASIPYEILKQIMAACAQSGYRNMSLAVKQLSQHKEQEAKR